MKYPLSFIACIAFTVATAQGLQGEKRAADTMTYLYSVPAPSEVHGEPSSAINSPIAPPIEATSDDACSTALTTITTTRTVSVSIVTQIPSSLASLTGIVDLSSFMPPQPEPMTSVTGVIDLSTWTSLQPPSDTVTSIIPGSSVDTGIGESSVATGIEESSVAPPLVPEPTATEEPGETASDVVPAPTATAPGLPEFTAAAGAVGVPVVVAGVLGWAALVL